MEKELAIVAQDIKKEYEKLTSLSVEVDETSNAINLIGVRYRGLKGVPTEAQIKYLIGFDNVRYQSKSNLRKLNKWCISACINIAKENPDVIFNINS